MAYSKTNWVNGSTPINATNLNKIENELETLDTASETLSNNLGNLSSLETTAKTNIVSAINELVGKQIETGSNSNGFYVKFADGTMICYNREELNKTVNTAAGSLYRSDLFKLKNYPASFISLPTVQVFLTTTTGDGSWIMNTGAPSTTNLGNMVIVRFAALTTSTKFYANTIAIGKWK